MTEPPATITYAFIVLRDIVSIALIFSALNDLPVNVADIQNSYITVHVTDKIWTILGQDLGEDAGSKAIMVWDLYVLKSAGAAFRNHLADFMHHLGLFICPVNLYLWINPMVRREDGFDCYAYILIYVDDVVVIYNDVESVLWRIDEYFKLKPSSIGDPDIYLVSKLNKMRLENGVWAKANIPARYVK